MLFKENVQSYLKALKKLIQVMTVQAIKEVLSSDCLKLYIWRLCILVLLRASILFIENNLGTHKGYAMHDSLPNKLNFYTGKAILS